MNNYLLIGLERLIDHIGSIRDLGIVYWKKANKKMQVGDKFCISFYQVISNRKYIDAFINLFAQESLAYEVSGPFMKNLPGVELPVK